MTFLSATFACRCCCCRWCLFEGFGLSNTGFLLCLVTPSIAPIWLAICCLVYADQWVSKNGDGWGLLWFLKVLIRSDVPVAELPIICFGRIARQVALSVKRRKILEDKHIMSIINQTSSMSYATPNFKKSKVSSYFFIQISRERKLDDTTNYFKEPDEPT